MKSKFIFILLIVLIGMIGTVSAVTTVNTYLYGVNATNGVFITPAWSTAQQTAFCTAGGWGNYFPGGSSRLWYHSNDWTTGLYDSQNYQNVGAYDQPSENRSVTAGGGTLSVRAYTTCQNDYPDRHFLYEYTTAPWPTFNWTASPLNGTAPQWVNFTVQNSTHAYTVDFGDGQILNYTSEEIPHVYSNPGTYSPKITIRNTSVSFTRNNYIVISAPPANLINFTVAAITNTGSFISGAGINIRNNTDNTWNNATYPSGVAVFNSSDGFFHYPLSIGETFTISTSATGFVTDTQNYTLQSINDYVPIVLTNTQQQALNGTWNLNVWVRADSDCTSIEGATVTVITGVSGQCTHEYPNGCTNYADQNGLAAFTNITPSSTAMIEVVDQAFYDTSVTVPVNPNTTQNIVVQMISHNVPLGKGLVGSGKRCTIGVLPVPTFPNGSPIPVTTAQTQIPVQTQTYIGQTPIPTPIQANTGGFWTEPKNTLKFMGADDTQIAFLLGMLIIFGCAVLGASPGLIMGGAGPFNPIGAEIGAITGTVLAMGLGFFPMFVVIIGIVGLILYVSIRVYSR